MANHELTPYAKFYFKFLGFNFKNPLTGKIYRKGEFWDGFETKALATLETKEVNPPIGFHLVDFVPIS